MMRVVFEKSTIDNLHILVVFDPEPVSFAFLEISLKNFDPFLVNYFPKTRILLEVVDLLFANKF